MTAPPPPPSRQRWFVAVLSVALLAFSATAQLLPAYTVLYVPLGLAVTGAILLAARYVGLDSGDLGLERSRAWAGLRLGGFVALAVGAGLAITAAVPPLHPLFEDERVGDIGVGLLAYRTLIRIPLGTVVLEEVAFRGALFGAWRRLAGSVRAAAGSSLVFGLWHVRPTIELLQANDVAQSGAPAHVLAVGGAVVATTLAGVFFCLLRTRTGSLVAPMVAHAAINSLATIAAFAVLRGWV